MTIILPKVGDLAEGARRDLKLTYDKGSDLANKLEAAKDMAAFANGVGGQIIVGAREHAGRVQVYKPLKPEEVSRIDGIFNRAATEHLRPRPVFAITTSKAPDDDDGEIVVVTVEPFPGQAVGVLVPGIKSDNGKGEPSYWFPVRVGDRTVFFEPDQLGLIMDAHYRRIGQLLASIPEGTRLKIKRGPGSIDDYAFVRVDIFRNVYFVRLVTDREGNLSEPLGQPIDAVHHVYPSREDGCWMIKAEP